MLLDMKRGRKKLALSLSNGRPGIGLFQVKTVLNT